MTGELVIVQPGQKLPGLADYPGDFADWVLDGMGLGRERARIVRPHLGEPLPKLTSEIIDQMNARHAEKHAGCTKNEVLGILEAKVPEFVRYVAGLSDEDVDRAGYLALLGSDVSIEKLIELVVLNSGRKHLENMKGAVES